MSHEWRSSLEAAAERADRRQLTATAAPVEPEPDLDAMSILTTLTSLARAARGVGWKVDFAAEVGKDLECITFSATRDPRPPLRSCAAPPDMRCVTCNAAPGEACRR